MTPTLPIAYRDHRHRLWFVSEVARVRVVSAAIDGPSHFLVVRFEREGEERFARWIGGDDWHENETLDRLFTESEAVAPDRVGQVPRPMPRADEGRGGGPAPAETIRLWLEAIAAMGPDQLAEFEERTFRQWDQASLGDVRRAIKRRREELNR